MARSPLLEVNDLTVQYKTKSGAITAVSDASFSIDSSDYFGLVGESGCGKSTIVNAILGALPENGEITSGEILYRGEPIHEMTDEELNETIRWKEISWIPQGSFDSLDPIERISDKAYEVAKTHTDLSREEALAKFKDMFEVMGLQPERIHDYPTQFSGGMQQRAVIAMALFLEPRLIIADEPTTALDVIMQDQIFKYLQKIRDEQDVSMMIITHDIAVVFENCNRIAVMHSGQVSESGDTKEVYDNPRHPYTILLKEAFPDVRYPGRELETIDGYPPQLTDDVDYCTFVDRCPWSVEDCHVAAPELTRRTGEGEGTDHKIACVRRDEVLELYREGDVGEPTGLDTETGGYEA